MFPNTATARLAAVQKRPGEILTDIAAGALLLVGIVMVVLLVLK